MIEKTKEHDATLYEKYTRINKTVLKIVFLWPTADGEDPFYKKVLKLLLLISFLVVFVKQGHRVYTLREDLSSCLEILSLSTTCLIVICRIVTFSCKGEAIRKFESFNRDMWIEEFQNEENRKTMLNTARSVNILSRFIIILSYICLGNFICMPMGTIYHQWRNGVAMEDMIYNFPFFVALNFRNPVYNAIVYMYLVSVAIFIGCWISGIESFYIVAIQYTILHIRLLREALFRLRGNANALRDLRTCIIKHNRIYRNAALINDIFGPVILSLFVFNTISMCLVLFNIVIMNGGHNGNFGISISYLTNEVIFIFFYCYFGNNIINESVELCNAIYDVDWYEDRPNALSFCNSIRIMMIRSQNPITITASGFVDVSLSTMTSIASTTLSYFTLVKKMYEEK
uniref:Odorant receptor n=1 Tax=Sirex nitobei TaxID=1602346 RepID=A0A857N562_9HYME|nr:odorant receptor 5 [Sirex nitobei]